MNILLRGEGNMISDLIIYIQTNLNTKEQIIFMILTSIITVILYMVDKKIDNKKIKYK